LVLLTVFSFFYRLLVFGLFGLYSSFFFFFLFVVVSDVVLCSFAVWF